MQIHERNDDMPIAHVAMAVEVAGHASDDNIPLMIANTLIGSYDRSHGGGAHLSSNIAALASKNPGVYGFQTFNTVYRDTGLW